MITLGSSVCLPGFKPKYNHAQQVQYVNKQASKSNSINMGSSTHYYDTFNPYAKPGKIAPGATILLFETLITQTADDITCFYPQLAQTLHIKKQTLSMTLNPLARFSDQTKVTTADVVHSYHLAKQHPLYVEALKDLSLHIESNRLVWHYSNLTATLLALAKMPIIKHSEALIGSGPYFVNKASSTQIQYQKNDLFWAENLWLNIGRNNFKHVNFHLNVKPFQNLNALSQGKIDWFLEHNAHRWDQIITSANIQKTTLAQPLSEYTLYLRINPQLDYKTRQFIAHSINFDKINQALCHGFYTAKKYQAPTPLEAITRHKPIKLLTQGAQWTPAAQAICHQLEASNIPCIHALKHPIAYQQAVKTGAYDLIIEPMLITPSMQLSDLFPHYLNETSPQSTEQNAHERLEQLIQSYLCIPMWTNKQFRIVHNKAIHLDHLNHLEHIDWQAMWKTRELTNSISSHDEDSV
ncbi:ABC transporter substrate-binding protein [Candidatus Comchoanobacter bicostacola]|uniref:ABC transporter substrate-binding protein n=1 Tax=Candidatus Comchoanobacter bicostacola TaxID=2919598 RepID=A0ABY5DJ48_9GAMM|nr:ABC transporter substrate-binding protein [Candidatus Comchoanobacter bicostacola]UTC24585.1 ABC transporter substrate-binding protein [Candidatus Comchoanobacter bicostacola]